MTYQSDPYSNNSGYPFEGMYHEQCAGGGFPGYDMSPEGFPGYGMSMGQPQSFEMSPGGPPGSPDIWNTEGGMEERMLKRRAERMYQSLAAQDKFSQIDKARHNKNYRNYLLQNYDESEGW